MNSIPQKAALTNWKKVKVWMMIIAASLMGAGAAEKHEQLKGGIEMLTEALRDVCSKVPLRAPKALSFFF